VEFLQDATFLVILRDDRWFVTEKEIQPAELSLRLANLGVAWKDIKLVLRLPPGAPRKV